MSSTNETETVDGIAGDRPPERSAIELRRGAALDHFIVLDELGRGGMGVVVCAYDPDVDRRVAIKVLHEKDDDSGEARRRRALREAQAMGKLSHPNVVTVYEVGVVAGHPFIVMEYVDGASLRAWLDDGDRDRDAIVDVFRRAGRGLAAAHEAGLVHRDFKPENVLIDEDGRAAVADFGIAGLDARDDDGDDNGGRTRGVGTPAYMSPEQRGGEAIDARSDQYSFCVALYEAIHGARPADGDGREPLDAPAWLRALIDRGLSPDPADRYASMHELLAALDGPPARRRFPLFAVAVAVLAIATVATFALVRSADDDPCDAGDDKVAAVWNGSVADRMRSAFETSGRDDAGATHSRVVGVVGAYLDEWAGMYTEACRATNVYHEQSPALLDRRSSCLNERLAAVAALAAVLTGELTADQIDNAYHAARALPSLDECSDIDRLEAVAPPPADETARRTVDELREKLLRAEALSNTGDFKGALPDVVDVTAAAALVGYAPLIADAQNLHGYVLWELGEHDESARVFEQAIVSAGRAADDHLAVTAMGDLMVVIGMGKGDFDRALGMMPVLRALVARAGDAPMLRASLHKRHSTLLYRSGAYVEAEAAVREALAIYATVEDSELDAAYARRDLGLILVRQKRPDEGAAELEAALSEIERLMGADHPETLVLRDGLGGAYAQLDRLDDALAQHERALAVREKVFGAGHWKLSTPLNNVGTISMRNGDYEAAQRYFERAIAARRTSGHGEDGSLATTIGNLGLALRQQGKFSEAAKQQREALRIHVAINGADHLETANAHNMLAGTLSDEGNNDEALEHVRAALAIQEAKLGPNHVSVGTTLLTVGMVQQRRGRCDLALPVFRRVLEMFDSERETTSLYGAVALIGTAQCHVDTGRYREAIGPAETALAVFDDRKMTGRAANAKFTLAQAMWHARPKQRARARELARESLVHHEAAANNPDKVARIRAWIESHP